MLIDTIKKTFKRVDQGECLEKCDKKIVKDPKNPEVFIVVCNGCKRVIFEKKEYVYKN
jgi:predicted metal-binding protein